MVGPNVLAIGRSDDSRSGITQTSVHGMVRKFTIWQGSPHASALLSTSVTSLLDPVVGAMRNVSCLGRPLPDFTMSGFRLHSIRSCVPSNFGPTVCQKLISRWQLMEVTITYAWLSTAL